MQAGDLVDGRFQILRRAAAGGMGTVYRAVDRLEGGEIALKLVPIERHDERRRLLREAAVLRSLEHPHVVRFVADGIIEEGELGFVAMEWVPGESLSERLSRAELTPRDAVAVAKQVASALAAVHAKGVVHRDVKPSNIMLVEGDTSRVRLIDFGVARQRATDSVTATGALVGTPGYMSPEQAEGLRVGPASDVFALGSVLYRCLTGKPPFEAYHVIGVLANIINGRLQPLEEMRPELPRDLVEVVERMMALDMSKRLAGGAAVLEALERLPDELLCTVSMPGVPSLGDAEQRLMAIIVVQPPVDASQADSLDRAVRELAHLGVELDVLDGILFAALHRKGPVSDLAAHAARVALSLCAVMPRAKVAIATGRGRLTSAGLDSDVVESARSMLDEPRPERAIALDSLTARLLDTRFEVDATRFGYLLRGERPTEVTVPQRALRARVPFVGRKRELALLEAALTECLDEEAASACVVHGPPGVGKTRLLDELVARHPDLRVLAARADGFARRAPFELVAELARRAVPRSPGTDWRAAVDEWVAGADLEGQRAAVARAFLGHLVGADPPQNGEAAVLLRSAREDPSRFSDQIRAAFVNLIDIESQRGPLVLVLDDMHWGDPASIRCVDETLDQLAERAILAIGAGRPELRDLFPSLWQRYGALELHVVELGRRVCERLVREVLGPGVAESKVAEVVERAGGNAFFLEELLNAARQGGDDTLPQTVLAMIQSRLETLSPHARRFARALAVYGKRATRLAVAALVGESNTDDSVAELVARGVLEPSSRKPSTTVAFRSDLIQSAAYELLTVDDRRVGHRLAAEWLETHGERSALRLGEHWARAGERARSLTAFERASEQALEAGDWAATVELARRAISFGPDEERAAFIELFAVEALAWSARYDEMIEVAERVMARLPRGGQEWSRAACAILLVGGTSLPLAQAVAIIQDITSTPLPHDARPAQVRAHAIATILLSRSGRPRLATPVVDRLRAFAATSDDPSILGWARLVEVYQARFVLRDPAAGRLAAEGAVEQLTRAGDSRSLGLALTDVAFESLGLGFIDDAVVAAGASLSAADTGDVGFLRIHSSAVSALVFARAGRLKEGRALAHSAIELADRTNDGVNRGYTRNIAAMIEIEAGEFERALDLAEAALEAPLPPSTSIWAMGTHARSLAGAGRTEEALELAHRIDAEIDQMNPPDLAELRVLGALPEALAAAGRLAEARSAAERVLEVVDYRVEQIESEGWRASFRARPEVRRLDELARAE